MSQGLSSINNGIRFIVTIDIVRLSYNGGRCKLFIISSVARQRRKILFNSRLIALVGLVERKLGDDFISYLFQRWRLIHN